MKHTIKLLTLAAILTAVFGLTGCPGPVNNYIEPEYTITVNVTNGTAEYPATAKAGETVTITATAEDGYVYNMAWSAYEIPFSLTETSITWNLTMPAENVVINVTFKAITVDDGNTDQNEPTEEPTDSPTDTNDDGEEETPVVDDNGDTEDEETEVYEPTYIAGGDDSEHCPANLRYEHTDENDYQIEAYIYKVNNNELVKIDTLYFSFDSSNLTSPVEMITEWGEIKPAITISNLVHLKTKYINARVTYFIGSDISTLTLDDFNTLLVGTDEEFTEVYGEDWSWSNIPYTLVGLDTNSPINIVIE